MLKSLLLSLLLLPIFCFAQYTISGRVLNQDKKPVSDASVYISNASVGSKTSDDGSFKLYGVKNGFYELVVSSIGYEAISKRLYVDNADQTLPDIEIKGKIMQLKEVVIGTDQNRDRNFNWFKDQFLGTSENAAQCTILNRDVIDLYYSDKTKKLSASSDDLIEVENNALGYKIKYLLGNFLWDQKNEFISYQGSPLFEPMKGSSSKQKRWEKNRLAIYEGSSMHFLRSSITNTIESEGFRIYRLTRKPNPVYKPGLIGVRQFLDSLHNPPLQLSDLVKRSDQRGKYVLADDGYVSVVYSKKPDFFKDFMTTPEMSVNEHPHGYTLTTLSFAEQYVFFDSNGVVINTNSLIYEGGWGKSRLADLLPVDYTPPQKAK